MFKAFLTKTAFRLTMLAALFLFFGVFWYAMQVDKRNVAPEGLRLPAEVASGKAIIQERLGGPQLNQLERQHMTSNELAMRLSDIVAESLSLTKSNYTYNTAQAEKFFTATGYSQYKEFLSSASFQQVLSSGALQSAAYVEQEALLITSGVYGGAYKWLFEVPVTISFIPPDAETYRNDETRAENRRILLRAQFTRVADPADPLATKIEIWQVLPARRN